MRNWTLALMALVALAGCLPEADAPEDEPLPARAVRTIRAETAPAIRTRTLPSVLEPPEITRLAFEVGGRLTHVDLQIGQEVEAGEVLMEVDPQDLELRLRQSRAALDEAESALDDARQEAERQRELFSRDVTSAAARDRAEARLAQAEARVEQARRALDIARDNREDSVLRAPFDGVINSVEAQSFATVQAGAPVLSLYEENGLRAEVLVSYDIVSHVARGQQVRVIPADGPGRPLPARIAEVARRAPSVSAFPVVVELEETPPTLRSGMAVDVAVDLPLSETERGIPLPLSALATHLTTGFGEPDPETGTRRVNVFVVRPEDMTLELREITVSGVDEARLIVVAGLEDGERVVTAGVPFLHPGQEVTLWSADPAEES